MSNQSKFSIWMSNQVQNNGKKYAESTISNYISILNNGFKSIQDNRFRLLDVFNNMSSDEVLSIHNALESNPDFNNINTVRNGAFSAALDRYHEFLESENNNTYECKGEDQLRGDNIILYGVPGSGKSYIIENEYIDKSLDIFERVVFHPEYSYSDFIGKILPVLSERNQIKYEFVPGPITNILKSAYEYPGLKHILVIEEINRGNAAAIFGDLFQLLDRLDEPTDGFNNGASRYGISNSDISKVIFNDEAVKVRFPSNFYLLGTMNTSDQNIFTLDTAFQRRWKMKLVQNDFDKVDKEFANKKVLDTSVTWRRFCETINQEILENNQRLLNTEDKRLGVYFVTKKELDLNEGTNTFSEKVIKYLWDDAFKFSRDQIFDVSNFNTLEEVISKFNSNEGVSRLIVFNSKIINLLVDNL